VKAKIPQVVLLAFILGLFASFAQAVSDEPPRHVNVVYHMNDSTVARMALNNIRNHLNATNGQAHIVVVAHGDGVNFLLDGAEDKNGNPYNITVEELMARGVDFRVCNKTPSRLGTSTRKPWSPAPRSCRPVWRRSPGWRLRRDTST
jgi:intracellular sulfur oxidation DsrE/DsrF family protein